MFSMSMWHDAIVSSIAFKYVCVCVFVFVYVCVCVLNAGGVALAELAEGSVLHHGHHLVTCSALRSLGLR